MAGRGRQVARKWREDELLSSCGGRARGSCGGGCVGGWWSMLEVGCKYH